jgi:riboflavin kinase/FMN adenylyltransferase
VERWRGLGDRPTGWGRCVVTIGAFDGVHRGHQVIIGRAVERAKALGQPSVVITFDPHPSEVVRPGSHPAVLAPLSRRADLVEALGVDVFCVLPFTLEFSRLTPAEFAHEVLVDALHASTVVVGENFRFGSKAAGNVAILTELGARFGFATEGVAVAGDGGTRFSSTSIRALVAAGEVEDAATALGRPHRIMGIIVRGDTRGREIGYPTANLEATRFAAIPADGVYAGHLIRTDGKPLPAAISVGTNPTFDGSERRVEAYVLDFSGDLYGEYVSVDFVGRLRAQIAFDSVEALVKQIDADVDMTRSVLAKNGN